MDNRTITPVKPLHPRPASYLDRYLDFLMTMTYHHPSLMSRIVDIAGTAGAAMMVTPWLMPAIGFAVPYGRAVTATGALVAGVAGLSRFAQRHVFGLPVPEQGRSAELSPVNEREAAARMGETPVYMPSAYAYGAAKAEMIVKEGCMPRLRITAANHHDAGYVEGYLVGSAIRHNLTHTNFLYPLMCLFLGAPLKVDNLKPYLDPILDRIPKPYREEMQGKVKGYNQWLLEHHPDDEPLAYYRYVLLQLMPDLHNHNPFFENKISSKLPAISPSFGCTTILLRLGAFMFVERVLDWPAHGIAGNYFLQIDRNIADTPRTIDVSVPLLTGALTTLNADGTLFEMNIARGDKAKLDAVRQPQGMPAVFLNRYCAEHAKDVVDIHRVLNEVQPLSAYHLTAVDGRHAESFHFYQHHEVGKHDVEVLSEDAATPKLMVVANHGVRHAHATQEAKPINHKDSSQRKANIHQLFSQPDNQHVLQQFIDLQKNDVPVLEDVKFIKNFMLELARVALVCNCESVLVESLVYFEGKLIDINAVTDNLYAQKKELEQFKALKNPRAH